MLTKQIAMVSLLFGCLAQQTLAAPNFNTAVQDYNAGRYPQALSEFNELKQIYSTNALVHYYLALCEQAVGHLDQAKNEFSWVSQYGDAKLKAMAQSGLQQLSSAHTSGSSSGGSSYSGSSNQVAASAPKVKRIIEFYADW